MHRFRLWSFFLLLTLAGTPRCWAHARLIRSEPKAGATLTVPPAQIELWFNELLEDGFNTATVIPAEDLIAAKKKNFALEKPSVDPRDRTHLIIKLAPLPPGEYIVEWRVLSRDGHSAPGRMTLRMGAR